MSAIDGLAMLSSAKGTSLSTTTARFIGMGSVELLPDRTMRSVSACAGATDAVNKTAQPKKAALRVFNFFIVICSSITPRVQVFCPLLQKHGPVWFLLQESMGSDVSLLCVFGNRGTNIKGTAAAMPLILDVDFVTSLRRMGSGY
jgi:hypothetical protein